MHAASLRGRHRIAAPAMTGQPDFDVATRIHANTLEHLVPFLVLLWMCAIFFEPLWAAALGIIWLFGRVIYAVGYWSAPPRRQPGFILAHDRPGAAADRNCLWAFPHGTGNGRLSVRGSKWGRAMIKLRHLVAGNWKMNGSRAMAAQLIAELKSPGRRGFAPICWCARRFPI